MILKFVLLGSAALVIAQPAAAQSAPPANAPATSQDQSRDIIITAPFQQSETDVLSGTSVISGEQLTRDLRPTIGETLAKLPGVSASSFGPSASRPILRGFQGERAQILTDGIGAIDVSNTSVDHAVIIDPLLAERVEVLRGPSVLLFGSSVVGGLVNVIDTRIPRSRPADGYRLNGIATYGSAANERSIAAAGDVAVGQHLVLHADGSYARSGDLHIGGYALTEQERRNAIATSRLPQAPGADPIDFAGNAQIRGTLPNSGAETWAAGTGAALLTEGGSLGVSYSHYASVYGVPIRYATLPGQGQEAPRLDVNQNRYDLRGEIDVGGGLLDKIRVRMGHANYRHFELADDGSIGTSFFNNGTEARLELVQANRGGWQGASGVQFFNRAFNVLGDEAFLPRSETNQTSLFTLQQASLGKVKAEIGGRYEMTDVASRAVAGDLRFFGGKRSFTALSGSVGASYGISDAVRIGLNLSHTERAPSADELFANGAHAGTQAYELGNPNFKVEKSWGLEGTFHAHGEGYSFDASAYYSRFSNYISENQTDPAVCQAAAAPSGRTVDFPCFQSIQADASYYGVEAEGSVKLATVGDYTLNADALGDFVQATILDSGPVPRIPAMRVLGGLEAQSELINARIEAEHVFEQTRIAAFETPTNGYTLVNASASISPFGSANKTTLALSANNIFDVVARRHASFLKDFAPLAGRDIRVTLKFGI